MARYRDDGEVQIDNSTNGRFRIAFQWLIVIAVFNVGTLLIQHMCGRGTLLDPSHMDFASRQVNLIPPQVAQLNRPQTVTVGSHDHRCVAEAVAIALGGFFNRITSDSVKVFPTP